MKTSNLLLLLAVTLGVALLAFLQVWSFTQSGLPAALRNTSLAAIVTAFYAGLVWAQLQESWEQRRATRATLQFLDTCCHIPANTSYSAWTSQCAIQNNGPDVARECQVLLTDCRTLTDNNWRDATPAGKSNLIARLLLWSNDDPLDRTENALPTRGLIPGRPYLFDLGIRDKPTGILFLSTAGDPTTPLELRPGLHCLEVTAYAANSDSADGPHHPGPAVGWFEVQIPDPNQTKAHPKIRLLPKPPWPKPR